MTMTLDPSESSTSLPFDEREQILQVTEEATEKLLEQIKSLIGKSVYVTATVTHRFYLRGKNNDEIADVFVGGMSEEIVDQPSIIVGAVSNIVFFRTLSADGEEEQHFGAWRDNFRAVLAEDPDNQEPI